MFKKGLITLVCLAVLSAVCALAAATYSVRVQATNTGGAISVAQGGSPLGSLGTSGIKFLNAAAGTDAVVTIAPNNGFKIKELKKVNGTTVTVIDPATYNPAGDSFAIDAPAADPLRPAAFPIQGITATFESTNVVAGVGKTWQLQLQNTNAGGKISATRGIYTAANPYTTVGAPRLINFSDTGALTATVTANPGYIVKSVSTTGSATANADNTVVTVTGIPASGKSVNTVIATFAKKSLRVTTNLTPNPERATNPRAPEFLPNGIAPTNPDVAYGGTARFIITPTGANNVVKSISPAEGANVEYTDRFGNPVNTPFQGPVKVTIKNITAALTVSADFGRNTATSETQRCADTCHMQPGVAAAVKNVPEIYEGSAHAANNVGCVTCHVTMPGPVVKASVDSSTFNVTAASAGTVGSNYCAQCHANSLTTIAASKHYTSAAPNKPVCSSCHTQGVHNPAAGAAACSTCHANPLNHAGAMGTKSCTECHDSHNPASVTGALASSGHPAVVLYTFEEVAMQMNGGNPVPVQVDANGKGLPYSPKQTCGTSGCHVKNGVDYTYDKIADHAFHSAQGRNEYTDTADGKLDARKNKPWGQSTAMVGKW